MLRDEWALDSKTLAEIKPRRNPGMLSLAEQHDTIDDRTEKCQEKVGNWNSQRSNSYKFRCGVARQPILKCIQQPIDTCVISIFMFILL